VQSRTETSIEILFVEDSPGDALLTGQILAESLKPVKFKIARDGVQALQMLSDPAFQPALIILDLSLPILSGFEVLAQNPRTEIPVVIFSASCNKTDLDRGLALGAREYIQKPMDLGTYRSAVLGMLGKWVNPEKKAQAATL
jgi:CheY-like chemotaxis protein